MNNIHHRSPLAVTLVFCIVCIGLWFVPTGFDERVDTSAERCKARVVGVDNSDIKQVGLVKTGDQTVTLEILTGEFKGQIVQGNNPLLGQMDRDKIFAPGDKALVVLTVDQNGEIVFVNPQEHYRIDLELLLLGLFATALMAFGGWTGVKALVSFIFSGFVIWKLLVPGLLKGWDPILLSLGVVVVLTAVIIFMVAGMTRKGVTAFSGALLGILTSCVLSMVFTRSFHMHGAVMPFAETLLYSGYAHLDLAGIYASAVFLAASGAVMDLAMDVAASMDEVMSRKPDLSRSKALCSGLVVGRSVVGTMTTTLLLAYSGGYVTMLMAFMAQGIPLISICNLVYVAAEVLKTLVGSFGLVMVAPFTAVVGALVLKTE
jgi:uncharacterized membrane protein